MQDPKEDQGELSRHRSPECGPARLFEILSGSVTQIEIEKEKVADNIRSEYRIDTMVVPHRPRRRSSQNVVGPQDPILRWPLQYRRHME